jgi:DNA polymerase-3 subunit epsilon
MNFLAVDVETANADFSSICAIGFVYFKEGQVAQRLHFLVNPETHFEPMNISIHGVRPEDVANAPTMATIFPKIDAALSTAIVVHHTHFDKVALCRAAEKYGFTAPTCQWLDTARVARRAWVQFSRRGYGLRDLAAEFDFQFEHHNAVEDAFAAGSIMLRAIQDTGISLDDWLLRVEKSIAGDANKRISREGDESGPLAGEVVVFTGALSITRAEAANLAAKIGCDVAPGVTKRTTMLVVGDGDIVERPATIKTAKHKKAEKLISEGQRIKILCERDFRSLVHY